MILAIILVVLLVIALFMVFPFITVVGDSMHPTYKDHEHLRGFRFYPRSRIKAGMVICYKHEGKAVIKRVQKVRTTSWKCVPPQFYCVGDNADVSYDSRNYGYVSATDVICVPLDQRPKSE